MRPGRAAALACAAAVALYAAAAVEATPAAPAPSPNASQNASNSSSICFLNRFRAISPQQAEEQGFNLERQLQHTLSVGTVAFDVTLIVFGALMLVAGWKLFTVVLFAAGFGGGFVVTFFALSTFFNAIGWFNCWVLSLVPVAGGLVAAAVVQKTMRLAFFLIGAFVGLVMGFYAYNLGLDHYEQKDEHWVYWLCLLIPACLCGSVAVKLENKILAFATAFVGSCALVVGFDFLVLAKIDQRFVDWISPQSFAHGGDGIDQDHMHMDGFSLGPIVAALLLSVLGTVIQLRCQRGKSDDMQDMPYGGNGSVQAPSYERRKESFWN